MVDLRNVPAECCQSPAIRLVVIVIHFADPFEIATPPNSYRHIEVGQQKRQGMSETKRNLTVSGKKNSLKRYSGRHKCWNLPGYRCQTRSLGPELVSFPW